MKCQWCGESHDVNRLCERAQRGMTRRSFCFLFGAGVGAMALGVVPSMAEASMKPMKLVVMIDDELHAFLGKSYIVGLKEVPVILRGWSPAKPVTVCL